MAASIFHGPPGSFKSASAVWFEVLPALRAGRLVVTNVEGILPKEDIEIALGEEFPKTADLWRLSSQTDKGKGLWKRWFWWMPVKALILIDEVQDVFPADRTAYKPEEYDSEGIESLKDHLPEHFYKRYWDEIKSFTPEEFTEADTDDTGDLIFDENKQIIYPKTMREANMRHRKYNWDIVYCTPEITEIHKLVRSVCQFAYKHKYFDALAKIPYYFRRPRVHEHSPKGTGEAIKSGETKKWRKIPVDVHKLYKSTATGDITKRTGNNPLKSFPVIATGTLLLLAIVYVLWFLFFRVGAYESYSASLENPANQNSTENNNVRSNSYINADIAVKSDNLALPFDATDMRLTGMNGVYQGGNLIDRDYIFELENKNEIYSMNSDDLKHFGIKVRRLTDCLVQLHKGNKTRKITCNPKKIVTEIVIDTRSGEA
ncbi:zonular occludens toxin domain-containing protein [Thalassotalea sp. ND16A]|uniref:zonular occludens toxin domain-containing protein n=1 Tax=Thalassotalea sp. ND16A TaxID=1535422 RepID=UPI00051CD626|nr:zonular occludens toxin domain-containing protein [Thalassotalea sp. ND16A]KGK00287.1 hypothetical protein ND16A_3623 [Thalassotalea sp. ND16A]